MATASPHAPVRSRVTVPAQVRRGEPFTLRVLLGHPMETGHRRDAQGALVGRDIVTRLRCTQGDDLLLEARLYPAVAANPFFEFQLVLDRPGPLRLSWQGDHGFAHEEDVAVVFV